MTLFDSALGPTLPVLLVGLVAFCKLSTVLVLLGRGIDGKGIPGALLASGIALVVAVLICAPISSAADPSAASRARLSQQTTEKDKALFVDLHKRLSPDGKVASDDPRVLAVAALTSQMKLAFQMGFLLLLPFLVLELLAGAVVTAVGAQGLSAQTLALPFKLLLFVAVDGWALLMKGLLA